MMLETPNICKLCVYGDSWCGMIGVWCRLVEQFCLTQTDCQAKQLCCLREAIEHHLQIGFLMGHERTIIGKEGFLDEIIKALCFGSKPTKIKEGAIQMVSYVHPFLQTFDHMGQHARKEDVEENLC